MAIEGKSLKGSDRIERLRSILEGELKCSIDYEEARSIGEDLVSFFKLLEDNHTG